ncbi:leucine--tRNA ligase [Candidatus Gracilibacteria bacterium]|nr:leucine--tRNA ligase [Candidatus Gracilibacteria bacterium]
MKPYDHKALEAKWQKHWEEQNTFQADDASEKPKWYTLVEFPYPSGAGLHVGHVRSYAALDAVSRKKRMEGFNVLYPIGWDAFGLPTENYAIKTKIHPVVATEKNIATYKRQLKSLGLSYDWSREVNTTDPRYYKWTQWIFLQLYKKGLAYKKKMPINWCLSCKIGLANEEVVNGQCERCGGDVEKREKEQWMLAITKYADRLIKDLDTVDYLEKIKAQQINWIGRSEGAEIDFEIEGQKEKIKVFTTRPDTLFGATYFVMAPEHPLVQKMCSTAQKKEVEAYIKKCATESELARQEAKTKTGVFTGAYAINPVNKEKIPVWIADYVMMGYGTGAIMCVPAHDERDHEFAEKFKLPIVEVIEGLKNPFEKTGGKMKNSDFLNGLTTEKAIVTMIDWVEKQKIGERKINYKLRDWIFSRQRYWGEPIPIVHCDKCGEVPLPESDLPLELPEVPTYEPTDTGESPLARIEEWVNCACPTCGGKAKRETDTMPNWAGSSWYFLRYTDSHNDKAFASQKALKYWTPVDLYNGGMEHTTLHLLYSRFWHKFLYDCKLVPTSEPYKKRISHGMVLAEDGRKMSKSFGNVINPDEIVKEHGADTLRMYEMFMGPFDQAIAWDSGALMGMRRFLERIWKFFQETKFVEVCPTDDFRRVLNQSIKKVTDDLNQFKFNTAISQLMILMNAVPKEKECSIHVAKKICLILAPFAPHMAEELWGMLGHDTSLAYEKWPEVNPKFLIEDTVTYAVQINGKLRADFQTPREMGKDEVIALAKEQDKVRKYLDGGKIVKEIFVLGKIVGFVVK